MSSPSIPVVSPADLDEVVVYNSGGEEFEHRRRASIRDRSFVHGGGGGFSGGPEADQVLSCIAEGGEHGAVCREGGAFAGWSGKGGVLGGDSWKASSLPALGGGTQQEAAWARVIGGASGVSPLFSYPGHSLGTVVKSPRAYSFDHRGLPSQAGGGFDDIIGSMGGVDGAGKEHIGARGNGASVRGAGLAGASDADGGAAHRGSGGAGRVLEGDVLWAELEAARRREDWLANEAALGHAGILHELSPVPPFVTDGSFSGIRLGAGASGPLGRCLCGVCVDSGWVDAGVHGSASRVAAGDGTIGEVAGRALAMQCGGPRVVVGGGG
ncbi:hypothetical protein J132_05439 [Termitomyces sp. J132]|nr:hypothetical protein J132_05439 [Termitomyces sp. J132]